MPVTIEEVHRTQSFRLGRCGRLVVAVFHDSGSVAELDARVALQKKVIAEDGSHVMMTIIPSLRRPVDPDVRTRAAALAREEPQLNEGSILVVTATGLGAVLFRGFMATMALVVPSIGKQKIVKSVDEAVHHVWGRLGIAREEVPHLVAAVSAFASQTNRAAA